MIKSGPLQLAGATSCLKLCLCLLLLCYGMIFSAKTFADTVIYYASTNGIRGLNLDSGQQSLYTQSPYTSAVNAVAVNIKTGYVYYGSGGTVYYWDPAEGNSAATHHVIADLASAPLNLPVGFLNSGGATFGNGKYYIASEDSSGFVTNIVALTLSADGKQVVSGTVVDILTACGCTGVQLGGLGDIAYVEEGAAGALYGATTDISSGSGTFAGRWKIDLASGSFTQLAFGSGGQLSADLSGNLFITVGNDFHELNKLNGQIGAYRATVPVLPYDTSAGVTLDYGDAPESYGLAQHARGGSTNLPHLGSIAPDNELMPVGNSNPGTADDLNGDDEDAVSAMADLPTNATSYSVTLQCRGQSTVNGWIDLSRNGNFSNNELNTNAPVSCSNNQVTLEWAGISGLSAGTSYARFRTASDSNQIASPTGHATDGEVEDYQINFLKTQTSSCPAGHDRIVAYDSSLPLAIGPGRGWTFSTLTVDEDVEITDVNIIDVQGTHTRMSDLIFYFWRNNDYTRLFGYNCGNNDNFNFGFDDESSTFPSCPPTDGELHKPYSSLSKYDGLSSQADWSLGIYDRRNRQGGSLSSWGVELCFAPEQEPPVAGLAKSASVSGDEVTFELLVENIGDTALTEINILDNLDSVFGVSNYTLVSPPSIISGAQTLKLNPSYSGTSAASLITDPNDNSSLQAGEKTVISWVVKVHTITDQGDGYGQYFNQATLKAIDASGITITDLSDDGKIVDANADGVVNQDSENDPTPIVMEPLLALRGNIFIDNGQGGTAINAHNGLVDFDEVGIEGILVTVESTGGSSEVLATASTDASGQYRVDLPVSVVGSVVSVKAAASSEFIAISENTSLSQAQTGDVTDSQTLISINNTQSVSGVNFGRIRPPQMDPDHQVTLSAGGTAYHPHRFRAFTSGDVSFAIESQSVVPANPGWTSKLFYDENCNGSIDDADASVSSPSTVSVNNPSICVLVRVFAPGNALPGTRYTYSLVARMEYADFSSQQHQLGAEVTDVDISTVSAEAAGELKLTKRVENLTQASGEQVSGQAQPGDQIRYSIKFENVGAAPITDLVINDSTPAYTGLASEVYCPGDLPGSLQSCQLADPAAVANTAGYNGDIRWNFDGMLTPGASGWVEYIVIVE